MKKIYNDACDKNVAVTVIYSNGTKFYGDPEMTEEIPAEEMLNLFVKGVVAVKDGTYFAAKSCTAEGVIDFGFPIG